jgi:hypothetical protein
LEVVRNEMLKQRFEWEPDIAGARRILAGARRIVGAVDTSAAAMAADTSAAVQAAGTSVAPAAVAEVRQPHWCSQPVHVTAGVSVEKPGSTQCLQASHIGMWNLVTATYWFAN